MAGYVDLHLHIVPNVDDGVRSIDDAMFICRGLKRLGYEHLVTTPHIRRGMFENRKAGLEQAFTAFSAAIAGEPDMPRLSLSAEHHCDEVFLDLFESGQLLPYPGGNALLIEFPNDVLPPHFEQLAFRIRLKRMTPVIAHPERYVPLFRRTAPIDRLLEQEVVFQLDLLSLANKFGRSARSAAERMLEEGVYAIAASDCHRPEDVDRTAEAIERLKELVGEEEANLLLSVNPQRLLQGQGLL